MRDLEFIAGTFFEYDIPKEKRYLLKYFKSEMQVAFLKYVLCTGEWEMFREHTGHYCTKRMLYTLANRLDVLTETYSKAKADLSEEGMRLINEIEMGRYSVDKNNE